MILVVFVGQSANASDWQPLQPQYGQGQVLCQSNGASYACMSFQCHPERGVEFGFYTNDATSNRPQLAVVSVDDGPKTVLRWRDVGAPGLSVQNYNHLSHSAFIAALGRGKTLEFQSTQFLQFQIDGARRGIDEVLGSCKDRVPFDTYAALSLDVDERAEVANEHRTKVTYLHATDSWGNDLDSGLANPVLAGISNEQCIRRCVARQDCKLATYNTAKQVCFLKSDFGTLLSDANAVSTFVEHRPPTPTATALPGAAMVTNDTIRASPLTRWQDTVEQIRRASAPLAGACQAELASVQKMAASMSVKPLPETGIAGEAAWLEWSSAALSERVPVWLTLSVDRPVRFDGDGFYALNKGAIGPFGIKIDSDRQRAFAPLYARDNLNGGAIGIQPLEAGDHALRVTLVAYLRACREEVPLIQTNWTMTVEPAEPRIVLRDITAAYPYDQRIEVPAFDRRIELNDTRFQIQHLSDGSEVLAREGKELRLSPTKRFVTIFDDQEYEIIDIVDGTTVANAPGVALAFWNADSFFLSDTSPWAEMTIGATMRPRLHIKSERTGGSCCMNGGGTDLKADLENNIMTLNGFSTSLLNGQQVGTVQLNQLAPNNSSSISKEFGSTVTDVVDTVAPVYTGNKWNLPLGPFYVHGFSYGNMREAENPEDALIESMAQKGPAYSQNSNFGKAHYQIATSSAPVVLRSAKSSVFERQGYTAAMRRIGVDLVPGDTPKTWLRLFRAGYEPDDITASEQISVDRTIFQIEQDVATAGKQVAWSKYVKDPDQIGHYCEHFPDADNQNEAARKNFSAHDLDLAYRFEDKGRVIWVTRASCNGGTLGANLVNGSALNIFDSDSRLPEHASHQVDNHFTFGNNTKRAVFQTGFEAKLFHDRFVVTYAPGEGALQVFDLETRTFRLQLRYARRGDLLEDVFMDAEARHLYQLNSNGSFSVYQLSDGAVVLEGRYLDDEIVIWTATFHFDSTEEGAAFVELRFPGQAGQYSFQQFRNALRIPGLMGKVLNGTIKLPEVDVGVPPKITGEIASGDNGIIRAEVKVTSDAVVKTLSVFQDGVLTLEVDKIESVVTQIETPRLAGTRWISIVAEDENGLVSLPLNTDLGIEQQPLPRVHFLGVGVDYYASDALDPLNYAKRDALNASRVLEELDGKTLTLASSTLLGDRRATEEAIVGQLKATIEAASPGDHLVLFFAGHGLRDAAGDFYFGLSETDTASLELTGLSWAKLSSLIARRDIRVTLLLDACHAGAAGSDAFATNDGAVEALVGGGAPNITVFAAAKGRQFSGESASVGGGYFTVSIRKVLLDDRDQYDSNGNGVLEAVEFYRGIKAEVTAERGLEQTPWMVRNQLVGDYALF